MTRKDATEDEPLTRGELARLFRVFAHVLETAERSESKNAKRQSGVRLRHRPRPAPNEKSRRDAVAGLRKAGVLP